jgi:hypothetical protein
MDGGGRVRSRYEHIDRGYIHGSSIWHKTIFHIDCRAGGAQKVFEDVCRKFECAGWNIGHRSFDFRIIRRNGISWHISILSQRPEPFLYRVPD